MVNASTASYLEVVERGPFCPIGWLYERVYRNLLEQGLVTYHLDGYRISQVGKAELDLFRRTNA